MMHFELLWLDICQNFTGSPNTDINLCLVWVVLRGPVKSHGSWKAGTWIYACCLAFRAEEEVPVMTLLLKSKEHGSSADEAVLSLAVWAVQHPVVLSCVSWNSPGCSRAWQDTITLDSTRQAADLWWSPCLPQKRSTERPKRKWLTSNMLLVRFWPRTWTFSGLRGMGILSFG